MTPFIDFQFCVWQSDAVAHAIVRHNETAYQTAFLTNLFLKKSLITWQVLNQNFLLITWGQYQKVFLYLRKKGKKMPGDDRRGRVKREITKLAPFALVTVPKSSFFLTCMLIHAQAKWPCHEGVFLIPLVPHYWKCWLHSLSESWKKKSYITDKIPMVWPFTWNFLVVRFIFQHFTK